MEGQYDNMRAIDQIVNRMRQMYPNYSFTIRESPNNGFLEIGVLDLNRDNFMLIEFKENQEPVVLQLVGNDGFERRECGAIMDQLLELF